MVIRFGVLVAFSYNRHAHKSTVMDLKFNRNGNWLLTGSRDHLIKLFDIRNLSEEVQVSNASFCLRSLIDPV